MMPNADPQITDLDLDAYVDDQLTGPQRSEVEAYLARHPERAARVMRDLALHRDLRRALAPPPAPRPLLGAARRLAAARRRDAKLRRMLRLVPAVMLVGLGWLAHAGLGPLSVGESQASGPAPAMVTAALSAHEVSLLRAAMASQPEVTELDAEELRAATGIRLPGFDPDWTVRDAQVFPSPQGPGVEILFEAPGLGQVSHFAVRTGSFDVTLPRLVETPEQAIAWFQIGETAHVLIARADRAVALLDASRTLTDTISSERHDGTLPPDRPQRRLRPRRRRRHIRCGPARAHMLRIYNYMGLGLVLTGIVAVLVASVPAIYVPIFSTPLKWLVMLAPLAFVMFLSFKIETVSAATAQTLFWAFCAVMGLSLASIFLVFTGASIARAFFGAAAMFAGMSLYGYTTQRDLSKFGSFLIMGLIGVIIASIINIFLGSSALQFAISIIGILVFVGLTAWDTQSIKGNLDECCV
jgi:FtsH-binding integral membrane protein